jgi:PPOX class probable F420-dependent enzyme
MMEIPENHRDLLTDEKKAFAVLATLNKDQTVQASPLWFNYTDGRILINSARGRQKDKNMRERKTVALVILDPGNPYRYLQIQGTVTSITEKDADAHINALAHKYWGKDYSFVAGEVRVIYEITPNHIQAD